MKLCARTALLGALIAVTGIATATAVASASVATALPLSSWDAGIERAVSADVVASTSNGNATGKTCPYVPRFTYLPVN
jgi:hypothetical protein